MSSNGDSITATARSATFAGACYRFHERWASHQCQLSSLTRALAASSPTFNSLPDDVLVGILAHLLFRARRVVLRYWLRLSHVAAGTTAWQCCQLRTFVRCAGADGERRGIVVSLVSPFTPFNACRHTGAALVCQRLNRLCNGPELLRRVSCLIRSTVRSIILQHLASLLDWLRLRAACHMRTLYVKVPAPEDCAVSWDVSLLLAACLTAVAGTTATGSTLEDFTLVLDGVDSPGCDMRVGLDSLQVSSRAMPAPPQAVGFVGMSEAGAGELFRQAAALAAAALWLQYLARGRGFDPLYRPRAV